MLPVGTRTKNAGSTCETRDATSSLQLSTALVELYDGRVLVWHVAGPTLSISGRTTAARSAGLGVKRYSSSLKLIDLTRADMVSVSERTCSTNSFGELPATDTPCFSNASTS